jgi:hypothetical protein
LVTSSLDRDIAQSGKNNNKIIENRFSYRKNIRKKMLIEDENTNNKEIAQKAILPKKRSNKSKRIKGIIASVAISIILISIPLFFILNFDYPSAEINNITIDGNFEDWNDKVEYKDNIEFQNNPDIDISACKLAREDLKTSFYVEVNGNILNGHLDDKGELQPDMVRILIDTDRDSSSGYIYNGIGADYMFEIQGKNGKVIARPFYQFDTQHRTDTTRQQNDWSGWKQYHNGNSRVSSNINMLEAQVSIPYYLDSPREDDYNEQIFAMIQVMDVNSNMDVTETLVSNNPELLIIEQKNIAPEVLTNDISEILELDITARGTDIQINSIDFANEGGGVVNGLKFPIFVKKDTTIKERVTLDYELISPGTAVKVKIDSPEDIILSDVEIPVQLLGTGSTAYVKELPNEIVIDGVFGDWKNIDKTDDEDEYSLENPNINILNYAVHGSESDISFYLDVEGAILEGSKLPSEPLIGDIEENRQIYSGLSEEIELPDIPSEVNEDTIYIFLDTDNDINSGYSPFWFPFGADAYIEIIGQNGIAKSSCLYLFNGGTNTVDWSWSEPRCNLPVGILDSQLESQVSVEALGAKETPRVFYYIMDWTLIGDFSDINFDIPTQLLDMISQAGGSRGITSHLVINEILFNNNIGDQFIEFYNPTNGDIGEDFALYRIRGPEVMKILTLPENVPSNMYQSWNPDNDGFGNGDMLILKDNNDDTVDVVILPHGLRAGDSYQRYVDEYDGNPIDSGGSEEFYTGDFYIFGGSIGDTIDFQNSKSKIVPEFQDLLIPILIVVLMTIVVKQYSGLFKKKMKTNI